MTKTSGNTWTRLTQSVFGATALGGIMLWVAMPPIGWNLLAWVALVPWILIITQPELRGRRPYFQIWMAGFMYWLGTLYFIPIPHPALWVGWLLMSAALGGYVLVFIAASRQAIWRFHLSPMVVVPMVWTGLEWIRAQGALSFGMVYLSHSQYRFPTAIQIADLLGAYGLSFLMATFATGLVCFWRARKKLTRPGAVQLALPDRQPPTYWRWVGLAASFLSLLTIFVYGIWKLEESAKTIDTLFVEAIVIQGSIDTVFPSNQQEAEAYFKKQTEDYQRLTTEARKKFPNATMIVWPETIFAQPMIYDSMPITGSESEIPSNARELNYLRQIWTGAVDPRTGDSITEPITLLTGIVSYRSDTKQQFNSVALFENDQQSVLRYDKVHRVMFGEYIPLADWFPFLKSMTPIEEGLTAGEGPVLLHEKSGSVNLLPSVCFESTVPQLIRRHVNEIENNKRSVDWLVNLTNDGWFFGTSCLDFHLACNVFRAVEMRKPMLVAANTGFSAEIDAHGNILQQGRRRGESYFPVRLRSFSLESSWYRRLGDTPWVICGLFVGLSLLSLLFRSQ